MLPHEQVTIRLTIQLMLTDLSLLTLHSIERDTECGRGGTRYTGEQKRHVFLLRYVRKILDTQCGVQWVCGLSVTTHRLWLGHKIYSSPKNVNTSVKGVGICFNTLRFSWMSRILQLKILHKYTNETSVGKWMRTPGVNIVYAVTFDTHVGILRTVLHSRLYTLRSWCPHTLIHTCFKIFHTINQESPSATVWHTHIHSIMSVFQVIVQNQL